MKIQKVQTNQQTFGTNVYFEPKTAKLIKSSNGRKKFLNHIKLLGKNAEPDIFILSHSILADGKESANIIEADLYKFEGNKCYANPYAVREYFSEKQYNGKNIFANLKDLYEDAKENLIETNMKKEKIDDYISKLTQIG